MNWWFYRLEKNQFLLLFVWKIIICLFGLGNFFLLNCADLTDKIDIGLDIDFYFITRTHDQKHRTLYQSFFVANVLISVFFILQKSCNIISLGFFSPLHALQKWKIYVLHTADLLPIFMTLNYSRQERGDYRFIFGFSYFLLFLVIKGMI